MDSQPTQLAAAGSRLHGLPRPVHLAEMAKLGAGGRHGLDAPKQRRPSCASTCTARTHSAGLRMMSSSYFWCVPIELAKLVLKAGKPRSSRLPAITITPIVVVDPRHLPAQPKLTGAHVRVVARLSPIRIGERVTRSP
jgi:hypothetical protein